MRQSLFETLENRTLMSATIAGHETHTDPPKPPTPPTPTLTVPAKPSGLNALVAGKNVTLTWADNSNNETGFVIQRIKAGTTAFVDVGTVSANVKTFTDTTAPTGSDYYIVRAFNTAGRSEGSNPVNINMTEVVTVTAPKTLRTEAGSTTQIYVTWAGDVGATGGYVVERSLDGKTWTAAGTTGVGVRVFADKGLTPATKYFYRVKCLGDGGQIATSTVIIGMTKKTDGGK